MFSTLFCGAIKSLLRKKVLFLRRKFAISANPRFQRADYHISEVYLRGVRGVSEKSCLIGPGEEMKFTALDCWKPSLVSQVRSSRNPAPVAARRYLKIEKQ